MSEQYGGAVRVHALLGEEQLYVSDPCTLHHIVVKEQHIYDETDVFLMINDLIFSEGLIATHGTQHKKQRKMLNPVFSFTNMRHLLSIIQSITDQLLAVLLTELPPNGRKEINVIPWMSRTAMEYICQAGMGYTFNTLDDMRETVGTLDSISKTIYAEKKAAVDGHAMKGALEGEDLGLQMKGRDIISILLKTKLLRQMNTIIFAAFEMTTVAIACIFYILVTCPDMQVHLRSELWVVKQVQAVVSECWEDVMLPYDVLMGLPYLDTIMHETFHVYLPTLLMSCIARQVMVLLLKQPVCSASGEQISSIPLPEGTTVIVSILAMNHNKEVWGEDTSAWHPEFWLTALEDEDEVDATSGKGKIKYPGVYASMMTFLEGGRACIGSSLMAIFTEQVIVTLVPALSLELPSEADESGNVKEIYWKMNGLQVPVVRPPLGDDRMPQVPLMIRRVEEHDFLDD
ncbi:cytochrome P450 [Laetiporus sulphureus 93-53]|uniref:Cytochrome P450 n=1 Tax=Laetiporus sulphureus 93-53 TaxID=1314785 RepID=A0A165B988_9APHY|nr:cytochrome P450 [Laetiporus sulphureus 93-53]KZT00538.1 cytochrome P450 [Laetiporus sulphureus 93-53]